MSDILKRSSMDFDLKLIVQVVGASAFLLPYATSQSGILIFSITLLVEAYIIANSQVMMREMTQENEGERLMKYFTVVSRYIGFQRCDYCYRFLLLTFIVDVLLCTSFYMRTALDIIMSTWFKVDATERLAYCFRIYVAIALFLIFVEYLTERINKEELRSRLEEKAIKGMSQLTCPPKVFAELLNLNIFQHCSRVHINVSSSDPQLSGSSNGTTETDHGENDKSKRSSESNEINVRMVLEMLHGFCWKRFLLLFSFLFLLISIFQLPCKHSPWEFLQKVDSSGELFNNITMNDIYLSLPNFQTLFSKSFTVIPIVIFSLMHYTVFLPVCSEESRWTISDYKSTVNVSFILTFITLEIIALLGYGILGDSSLVLFTTGFKSTLYADNINFMAVLFTIVAMMLRIMLCCRLLQVFLKLDYDSSYWFVATVVFFITFFITCYTRDVLQLTCLAGSITNNLILIIFPRCAYIMYLTEADADSKMKKKKIFKAAVCITAHGILLLLNIWQVFLA